MKKKYKIRKSFRFTGGIREIENPKDIHYKSSMFDLQTSGGLIGVSIHFPRLSESGYSAEAREDRDFAERVAREITAFLKIKAFKIPYRKEYDPNETATT